LAWLSALVWHLVLALGLVLFPDNSLGEISWQCVLTVAWWQNRSHKFGLVRQAGQDAF
jgi:hypothetical protein